MFYKSNSLGKKKKQETPKKNKMIVPILILMLSILFLARFLNLNLSRSIKNLFSGLRKPLCSSPASPLPPEVSPSSSTSKEDDLKLVFDTFDGNRDGFLTRDELEGLLAKIRLFVPTKEMDELVGNLDSNKDGLVDFEEFRDFVKGRERGMTGEGDLKEAFDVFDGDGDGLITVEELGWVLRSLGLKEGNRVEDCKEMIKKVDVDGDGMVNFDEFKRMMMMMRDGFGASTSTLPHAF